MRFENVKRFLVIRLSSIGDIVHALPAVSALAESFPDAEVDWLVETQHAHLLLGNPSLAKAIDLNTLGWRKSLWSPSTWAQVREGWRALRFSEYDAVLDFQGLWKSAVLAWVARSERRIGFDRSELREGTAGVLYTHRVDTGDRKHVIEKNLALVEFLGGRTAGWKFDLPSRREDEEFVRAELARQRIQTFMILNPGGGWRSKCWSPANYAKVLTELAGMFSGHVLLTGAPGEEPLIEEILKESKNERAAYFPSSVLQFICLARKARLFVGGDTGPLHLAAAASTPIVGIYGPTNPARNGPFARADIVLWNRSRTDHSRRGTNPGYLQGVEPASVLEAIRERLARKSE
jgi:lipopolysaccharide heptosyltransferase I